MPPIELVIENLPAFLTTKLNASLADVQKFLLVRAIWIYAFLAINLTHESKY